MTSFWDLLPATSTGQIFLPIMPGSGQRDPYSDGTSDTAAPTQTRPLSFWDLLPATPHGSPFVPMMPSTYLPGSNPWLVATPEAGGGTAAAPMAPSANQPRGPSDADEPVRQPPATFWDPLPATPRGQPFVPTMPPTDQLDPWASTAAPDTRAFFSGADRATDPGFLGPALGQSASGVAQSSTTPQAAAGPTMQQSPSVTDASSVGAISAGASGAQPSSPARAVGAAAQDRGAMLAPWSASRGLLDYPVIGPVAGLTEYLMRGAAKSWQDGQRFSEEEATGPNRNYLPRPGERSPPSRYSAADMGDAFVGAIAAPFVATHDMMQPPLRPPADSVVDDSRQIWVKSRPDSATYDVLWQDADPDAAYAYYEDQQRRANFAPQFALGTLGVGSNFAVRGAAGMAGGRLTQGATKGANLLRNVERVDGALPASAAAAPPAAASSLMDAAETPPLAPVLSGQNHHAISKKIHNELEKHDFLMGVYRYQDRRFETRAIDSDAHRGYQKWHRDLDDEIAQHVRQNPFMSKEEFESYLRNRYAQPDLLMRFPNGL
jgi:hypothetical protein